MCGVSEARDRGEVAPGKATALQYVLVGARRRSGERRIDSVCGGTSNDKATPRDPSTSAAKLCTRDTTLCKSSRRGSIDHTMSLV
jgi:hypothetical protein